MKTADIQETKPCRECGKTFLRGDQPNWAWRRRAFCGPACAAKAKARRRSMCAKRGKPAASSQIRFAPKPAAARKRSGNACAYYYNATIGGAICQAQKASGRHVLCRECRFV